MKNLLKMSILGFGIALSVSSCNLFGSKPATGIDTTKKDTLKLKEDSLKKAVSGVKPDSTKKDSVAKK